MAQRAVLAGGWLGVLFLALPVWSQEETDPINLAREPDANVAQGETSIDSAALTDADPATALDLEVKEGAQVELVLEFGGETVAIERLVLQIPDGTAETAIPARFELLVSNASATSGYHVVRSDPLEASAEPQEFDFRPQGARWIMLRLVPPAEATSLSLAELEVVGRRGPPVTVYEFKQSPADSFAVLSKLQDTSLDLSFSADEMSLFADAQDGTFDEWSFAEAALLASGVRDKSARQAHLTRLDQLEAEAMRKVGSSSDPFTKGEQLLTWLHSAAMANGYESQQTDLSGILDTGKYNCVSSAVIYNVLGRRLGLDLRAIEVPDHAFSILYDGSRHADVETTTDQGFNPARDQAASDKLAETTGFRYIPDSARDKRRELGEPGLVAIIYYNHGVELGREQRQAEALMSYFRSLSLDPENQSAVKNVLAELVNWSGELDEAGKFDEAAKVVSIGLELAPGDSSLRHQHLVIAGDLADDLHKAGKTAEALAILDRAGDLVPDNQDEFIARKAMLFIAQAEELMEADRCEEAIAAVAPGVEQLSGEAQKELREWRGEAFRRWSQREVEKKRFAESVDVVERGKVLEPDYYYLDWSLEYAVQEWADHVKETVGRAEADQILLSLVERFPGVRHVTDVALNHVRRDVINLRDAGRFDDAIAAIPLHQDLLKKVGDENDADELVIDVIYSRSRGHMDRGEWQLAIDSVAQAFDQVEREDDELAGRLAGIVQEWSEAVYNAEGESAARDVLIPLAKRFAEHADVCNAIEYHLRRAIRELAEKEQYEEAIACVERHRELLDLLGDPQRRQEATEAAHDAWARILMDKQDWDGAIEVYGRGLKLYPESYLFKNNIEYCEQEREK